MLPDLKHVVLDLDGVLYNGDVLTRGAADSIRRLRDSGRTVSFCSNNSTRTRKHYADKLSALGIPTTEKDVVNSSYATGMHLAGTGASRALVIGEVGIVRELTRAGIEVFEAPSDAPVDCVVVGLDRGFNYAKLTSAQRALAGGADFVATNRDTHLPTETELLPGSGTMVAAVEALAGRPPVVVGKPQPSMLELLLPPEDRTPDRALMVGDRLDTDIECGNRAGISTALVLTGFSSRKDAAGSAATQTPDFIHQDLAKLTDDLLSGR